MASQIRAFFDYAHMQCMDDALRELKDRARAVYMSKSRTDWDKFMEWQDMLLSKHWDTLGHHKDAAYEFSYWSKRNQVIAGVVLEFLGIIETINIAMRKVFPRPENPYKEYFEDIEKNTENLIALLYSAEMEDRCESLSTQLYGIYYGTKYIGQDPDYIGPVEQSKRWGSEHTEGDDHKDKPLTQSQFCGNTEQHLFLMRREVLTLNVIYNARPEILSLDEIASRAKIAKQTVFSAMQGLQRYDFVFKNKRGNYLISEIGVSYFEEHFC